MPRIRTAALILVPLIVVLGAAAAAAPAREAAELAIVHTIEQRPAQATILFGGDMMFDRSIRQYADINGGDYLFNCLDPLLRSADLVVANLEGPITGNPSVSEGSAVGSAANFTFTFPTTTAALLQRHHVGAVTLANNHIYNQGAAGVRSTISYLDAAGVANFGDPLNAGVANLDVSGVPIALIGYNDFIPQGGTASTTLAQIARAKQEGRVPIVFAHWGVEYAPASPARVVALAHRFVEAGAGAVIGAHPHVVENSEVYRGAPIYYSLGNLIFDQYWDAAVSHGRMVELSVSGGSVSVLKEIPVVLGSNRQTCPVL